MFNVYVVVKFGKMYVLNIKLNMTFMRSSFTRTIPSFTYVIWETLFCYCLGKYNVLLFVEGLCIPTQGYAANCESRFVVSVNRPVLILDRYGPGPFRCMMYRYILIYWDVP